MTCRCKECNSTNIETKAWVDYNTQKFIEWYDDGDVFCKDCGDFVDITEDNEGEVWVELTN